MSQLRWAVRPASLESLLMLSLQFRAVVNLATQSQLPNGLYHALNLTVRWLRSRSVGSVFNRLI